MVLSDAVEHEHLDSNPALNVGRKHLRQGDEIPSAPDPFTTEDAHQFAETARVHFPRWYPFLLCGLRTGLRLGELSAIEATSRHTYASLLLSANVPLLYVSAQSGHSNANITLKTYAAWMPKTDARAHSALLDTTVNRPQVAATVATTRTAA